jgi:glycosyltransferase involved in cell wall biosynthesis
LESEEMEKASSLLRELLGDEDQQYFLFVGGVRYSKGPETLIKAWKMSDCRKDMKLLFAGKWVEDGSPALIKDEIENCVVLNRYLSNEEFVHFIKRSKCVILPYYACSHSSVIISCAQHNGAVIISDIELFKEYLPDYDLTFSNGDSKDLAVILDRAAGMSQEEVKKRSDILSKAVEESKKQLVKGVFEAYKDV